MSPRSLPRREHGIQLQQLQTIPLISTFGESSSTIAIVSSLPFPLSPSSPSSIQSFRTLISRWNRGTAAVSTRESMAEFRLGVKDENKTTSLSSSDERDGKEITTRNSVAIATAKIRTDLISRLTALRRRKSFLLGALYRARVARRAKRFRFD